MKWTRELPTVEGWYWRRRDIGETPVMLNVVGIGSFMYGKDVLYVINGNGRYLLESIGGEWQGPIKPEEG